MALYSGSTGYLRDTVFTSWEGAAYIMDEQHLHTCSYVSQQHLLLAIISVAVVSSVADPDSSLRIRARKWNLDLEQKIIRP